MVDDDEVLSRFLLWCKKNDLKLSERVRIGVVGSCHRYGMIALENIQKGESLFEIPRSLVLQPSTSLISEVIENAAIGNEERFNTERGSGWAPLLLSLMYEYTNENSFWKPYLDLVPDVTVLDQPMFWGLEERQRELRGSGIEGDIESDVKHIEEEYNTVALPFIREHKQYFSESCHTLSLYKHMAAFVMAYSFTEYSTNSDNDPAAPVMVPMADILNHISNHNAHLEFGADMLSMVAIQDIPKGKEVFNTYGKLANCHLLQSYGFVEDDLPNPYDMVEMPLSSFYEVMKTCGSPENVKILNAKFEFMDEVGVASKSDLFLFGREGCSQFGPDLYATLRILHLTAEQFRRLLKEEAQKQRSEEFDDIALVLDQHDKRPIQQQISWRILELISNAESRRDKQKRKQSINNSRNANKKLKKDFIDGHVESKKNVRSESSDYTPDVATETVHVIDSRNSRRENSAVNDKETLSGGMPSLPTSQANQNSCQDLEWDRFGSSEGEEKSDRNCQSIVDEVLVSDGYDRERNSEKHIGSVDSDCGKENGAKAEDDDDDNGDDDDDDEGDDDDSNGDDDDVDDDDDNHDDDDGDNDDDDDDDEEEEEEEDSDEDDDNEQVLSYEMLSQWPVEWRRTLRSVAELCMKLRYGDCIISIDTVEERNLTRRQRSVLRIKRCQRDLFRRISDLAAEGSR